MNGFLSTKYIIVYNSPVSLLNDAEIPIIGLFSKLCVCTVGNASFEPGPNWHETLLYEILNQYLLYYQL